MEKKLCEKYTQWIMEYICLHISYKKTYKLKGIEFSRREKTKKFETFLLNLKSG